MNRTPALLVVALLPLLAGCATSTTSARKHQPIIATAPKLEMKLSFIDLEEAKFGNRKAIQLDAEIRNVSDKAVFLPTIPHCATWIDGNIALVNFGAVVSMTTRDGFKIPLAPANLAIAEVRPGEAIVLSETFEKPAPLCAIVSYEPSKEFAERYGIWGGKIEGVSIQLK